MFRRTQRVLLALSGGQDSLSCLLVLRTLGEELGFSVTACHFDHQLRPDSKEDLERVRALCDGLGIECISGEGDVGGVAKQQRRSIEDVAREMRYQFLAFVAERQASDCIATGHTADDQAETVLMRVVRGSGVRGIRGMLPVSPVPGAEAQRLVRPLLCLERATTGTICDEFGLAPIVDASNSDLQFTRNRIRHEAMPVLEAVNPSLRSALLGLAASAREAFDPIEKRSFEVQPLERGPVGAIFNAAAFAALPSEAMTLVLEREGTFYHLDPEVNRTRLENLAAVLRGGSGEVEFGHAVVEVSCEQLRLGPKLEAVQPLTPTVVNVPGSTRAGDWVLEARMDELQQSPGATVVALDSAAISGLLRVRSFEEGDRIAYHGMERKVSDLLINEKVPAWERSGSLVLADGKGVLALIGPKRQFIRDGAEPDLWLRLSAIPQR
jgi:tRNA(Ile)-lysidine synthase